MSFIDLEAIFLPLGAFGRGAGRWERRLGSKLIKLKEMSPPTSTRLPAPLSAVSVTGENKDSGVEGEEGEGENILPFIMRRPRIELVSF